MLHLFKDEPFGYQRLASGICLQMMPEIYNPQQNTDKDNSVSRMVNYTKNLMYEKINLKAVASSLGVSYSKFRLDFFKKTGTSPLQFHLSLKIEKAKELLLQTDKRQKEIAYELGFESDYYFSRLSKQKTGVTPKQFRKK